MVMDKPRPRLLIVALIAFLFLVPLIYVLLSIHEAPVCVDPNARIEPDRILDCYQWENQRVIQFQF